MQYAIVILDGASGSAVPDFEGKTSLEQSATPNLDLLAQGGTVGLMQNVPAHLVSGSDVACLSIVGYDPSALRIGRGAIEGASLGIDLQPGQIACRLNLCYVEDGIMKGYSTDNIPTVDGHALAQELKEALDDDTFTLHLGTSFRQTLVVNGYPELENLEYETPHDNTGKPVADIFVPKPRSMFGEDGWEREKKASDLVKHYIMRANEVLAKSTVNARRTAEGKWPANFVWLFWPGQKPASMKSFFEVYKKRASLNSGVDLLDGIALLTGMRIYKFDGVTDGPTNDFKSQGVGGITMLEDGADVVIVHIEAPDAAGHDGRPDEKQHAIEQIDTHILGPLIEYSRSHPLRIAAMPDHPTPLSTRKHAHEPVPFVLFGPGILHNGAARMTEQQAQATGLVIDPGWKFMGDWLLAE